MAHSLEDCPLPQGWAPVSTHESQRLRKRFMREQPRIALLTQLHLEVIARGQAGDDILVRFDENRPRYFAAHLTGKQPELCDGRLVSVSSPQDLARFLETAD